MYYLLFFHVNKGSKNALHCLRYTTYLVLLYILLASYKLDVTVTVTDHQVLPIVSLHETAWQSSEESVLLNIPTFIVLSP
jgi:hypothetical protein